MADRIESRDLDERRCTCSDCRLRVRLRLGLKTRVLLCASCSMLLVQFRVLPCTFHHAAAAAAVFLNGIAAWQTHGAATQERRCKAFRLVSQKQNQISCNSRVLYSKCFLSLRFVLSDVISVGQRITWPAAKANTKTKTRLKFIAVKPPELRGLSPKLIRSVAIRLV